MAASVRFKKLEKKIPNVAKNIEVTTNKRLEMTTSARPTPPKIKARL